MSYAAVMDPPSPALMVRLTVVASESVSALSNLPPVMRSYPLRLITMLPVVAEMVLTRYALPVRLTMGFSASTSLPSIICFPSMSAGVR